MYREVSFSDFCDAFTKADRNTNFSYNGKKALFEHLEQYEEDTGEKIELDIIALCCEYTEYGSVIEAAENYGYSESDDDIDSRIESANEWLCDRTIVIAVEGGKVICQDF